MKNVRLRLIPLLAVLAATPALLAVGCGGSSTKSPARTAGTQTTAAPAAPAQEPGAEESFTAENWSLLDSDPDAHKGASVDVIGKVFLPPERDAKAVYFQMYADPQNDEFNTVVGYPDPQFQLADGDYVHVIGTVKGKMTGENAFGAKLTLPVVLADQVKKVSATAAAPPAQGLYGKATYTQAGITVTITKVEAAASETRVFVTVRNGSGNEISFYDSNAKLVQGTRQFEPTYSSAGYPEVNSDLLPGITSSGVIVFPPLPNPQGNLKIVTEVGAGDMDVGDYGTLTYIFTWS